MQTLIAEIFFGGFKWLKNIDLAKERLRAITQRVAEEQREHKEQKGQKSV